MRRPYAAVAALALALLPTGPMDALCIYKGRMNAKTTLPQEFSDSKWVVRAKVTAAQNYRSDEGESWTIYNLRVRSTFKGAPPSRLKLFTYRDSGGFYLDRGMDADLERDYLLFLDPISKSLSVPVAARSATEVNYNCGQSRAWTGVTVADQRQIARLAGH